MNVGIMGDSLAWHGTLRQVSYFSVLPRSGGGKVPFLALLMIRPWFVDIDTKTKNDPYIIIYKISQLVYFLSIKY